MTNAPRIIGITGNIATGKSVVGHMLANSGGLEIDADVVANRMLYTNGPAYESVINAFGEGIITSDGQISRDKLGQIVFSDPKSLRRLEELIHPAVTTAIQTRIGMTSQPFVIIEAIKLLESKLVDICDAIWVSQASVDHQMERLMTYRGLAREQALSRIQAQPPQAEKLKRATVVINTEGSFKDTWLQVQDGLNDKIRMDNGQKEIQQNQIREGIIPNANALSDKELEEFWQSWVGKEFESLYSSLGSKIFLPSIDQDHLNSLLLWNNWNFTAVPGKWIAEKTRELSPKFFFNVFPAHVIRQQCDVILISKEMSHHYELNPEEHGFTHFDINELTYPAWQEAARKISRDHDDKLWIKILNQPVEAKNFNTYKRITNDTNSK